jgi:hypothetical protein
MIKLHFLFGLALLTSSVGQANARGQSEESWDSIMERNLRDLSQKMLCNYVYNSVRNITLLEYNASENASVVSARYDYRCGDSTSSDTIYITFRNGMRPCVAYAFYNKYCTLSGEQDGTP